MELIKSLPDIEWKYESGRTITAQDFTVVYQISQSWFDNKDAQYDVYEIKAGETAESVARETLGSSSLYWVIYLANRITHRGEWYLQENQLLNYIFDKYYFELYDKDSEGNLTFNEERSGQAVFESLNFKGNINNDFSKTFEFTADGSTRTIKPHHFETLEGDWLPYGATGPDVYPVSIYDFESKENLRKRYIRIPPESLVNRMRDAVGDF